MGVCGCRCGEKRPVLWRELVVKEDPVDPAEKKYLKNTGVRSCQP